MEHKYGCPTGKLAHVGIFVFISKHIKLIIYYRFTDKAERIY